MLACTALLLVNFPVALAISLTAVDLATRYTVAVHNDSAKTLRHVRLSGGGYDVAIGTMLPGASVHQTMHSREEGQLEIHATRDTTAHVAVVDDYVTGDMGRHTIVRINRDGRISRSATRGTKG
ncbi:hypothetical protein SAMN05444166_8331 [Singulisphaera sp. GP187]|uniref:hypothetical protein n=1 Tax=Singulisphaera sp. GP187 TaxID=1882752 RepID=UPI00092B8298|nr:hypothetical protein [Singulisphaera sp. GP187]SIO67315.1 hypothetical protein SAMN05444166_8331 [Singulisphaera sp. GP187]